MNQKAYYDAWLLLAVVTLLGLGLVMVTSSSVTLAENQGLPFLKYANHQTIAMGIGLFTALLVTYIPIAFWQRLCVPFLLINMLMLVLLLIPGITRPVNGSLRWLFIGPVSIQISEFVKLAMILYMSSYLVRRREEVRYEISGFLKPVGLLAFVAGLILLEPDFGTGIVLVTTVMGMLFLGGVPFRRFMVLFGLGVSGLLFLSAASPYRMARLTAFLDPWADQFNTGYQLTQSLIAFGRGGILGTGLGNSIQKLLYLPEPHTDFVYAVLAEELGLFAALIVLLFFGLLVWRIFSIGRKAIVAKEPFAAFIAYGIALWLGSQTVINIGVNMGLLPTKGLTLPLMSYGGCSVIVALVALGLVFRIDYEQRRKII